MTNVYDLARAYIQAKEEASASVSPEAWTAYRRSLLERLRQANHSISQTSDGRWYLFDQNGRRRHYLSRD
jgi:hypothetical protein